jgi:hypothetical protein
VSPIFAYVMIFGLWLFCACLVWLAAALMSPWRRARPTARSLGLAMAGTFPAVLLYQMLAAPIVLAILFTVWLFWKVVEPGPSTVATSGVVIVVSFVGAISAFTVVLAMSLVGFYEGWRIGWACGKGQRLREVIDTGAPARVLRRLLDKMLHRKAATPPPPHVSWN